MELPFSELLLLVAAICGSIATIVYTRGRFGNTEINTKLKNRYNEYIFDLEDENKKLKTKIKFAKTPVTISKDAAEDPLSAISEVIEGLTPHLPASIRPLLKSKKAVDFITNYVQQNPDAVKDIITKFTQTKTPGRPAQTAQPNNPTMEQTL